MSFLKSILSNPFLQADRSAILSSVDSEAKRSAEAIAALPSRASFATQTRPNQPNTLTIHMLFLRDIADIIFRFVCDSPYDAGTIALVCSQFDRLITIQCQQVWKQLSHLKWPYISQSQYPTNGNWYLFYHKRYYTLLRSRWELKQRYNNNTSLLSREQYSIQLKSSVIPIENCHLGMSIPIGIENNELQFIEQTLEEGRYPIDSVQAFQWEFQCPIASNKLSRTDDPMIDYCHVCSKNVYWVKNRRELQQQVEQGNCVSFSPEIVQARNPPQMRRPMMRGKIAPPPRGPQRPLIPRAPNNPNSNPNPAPSTKSTVDENDSKTI